jgi:GxxExxY protein
MLYEELTRKIIGCAMDVHKRPGNGFQEVIYQRALAIVFQRDQSVISRHIRNVFRKGELQKKSNLQKMHITTSDKPAAFYSLDVITKSHRCLV